MTGCCGQTETVRPKSCIRRFNQPFLLCEPMFVMLPMCLTACLYQSPPISSIRKICKNPSPIKNPRQNLAGTFIRLRQQQLMLRFVVSFNPSYWRLRAACASSSFVLLVAALNVLFVLFVPFLEFHHGSSFIKQAKFYTTQ